MDNNYNNYNGNNTAYEDGANDEEDGKTYKYGAAAKANYECGARYTPTPVNDNTPENYEHETININALDKTPGMGAAEETEILDAI